MSLATAPEAAATVASVHVSLQVLLKIMQHARDAAPSLATGQLLGMDRDSVLEITEAFPFATSIQDELEQEEYLVDMMKALRDINVDHNTVGWYQSCSLEAFVSQSFIEAQYNYQSTLATSVVFVYDQMRSVHGPPAIKALRLKDEFMNIYRDKKTKGYGNLVGMNIFEELPIKISLSSLEQMFVAELAGSGLLAPIGALPIIESEQLALGMSAGNLVSAADDVLAEAGRLQHHLRSVVKQQQALGSQLHRLKQENSQRSQAGEEAVPVATVIANFRPATEPSRLPCLVASSGLHGLVEDYKSFSEGGAQKKANSVDAA